MSHENSTEYDGLAALTAVRELAKELVHRGALSATEAANVFNRSAEMHLKADTRASTDGNKQCAIALKQCADEILASLEK